MSDVPLRRLNVFGLSVHDSIPLTYLIEGKMEPSSQDGSFVLSVRRDSNLPADARLLLPSTSPNSSTVAAFLTGPDP